MFKQKLALALVLVMLFAVAGPALAVSSIEDINAEIHKQVLHSFIYELEKMELAGNFSNEHINQSVIDITYVSEGNITAYTYIGAGQNLTVNNLKVKPQTNISATDKLTRFVFEVRNMYYPHNAVAIGISPDRETVRSWTYGPQKDEAMYAVVSGLEECLGNPPITTPRPSAGGGYTRSKDDSWTEKYSPENIKTVTTFRLDSSTYTITSTPTSKSTSESVTRSMDVKPLVREERTFVPIRYLAYALGATEDDVHWDGSTKTVTLEFENATEVLTLGSQALLVNDDPVLMDVAPFAESGRTFLPARWIAEPLGAQVDWDSETQEVIITTEREIEQD